MERGSSEQSSSAARAACAHKPGTSAAMARLPLLQLSAIHPVSAAAGGTAKTGERHVNFKRDAASVESLRREVAAHAIAPLAWLTAAWTVVLARLSGQSEFSLGVAGIDGIEGEGAKSPPLALQIRIDDAAPAIDLVAAIARQLTSAANEHALAEAAPVASERPLFNALLTLSRATSTAATTPDAERPTLPPGVALHLAFADADASSFELRYDTDICDADGAERMAAHVAVALAGLVAHPDQPVGALPLLSGAQRDRLLIDFNATAVALPSGQMEAKKNALIQQPFEAQAAATPDAPALFADGQTLGYAELNARANQLAHRLLALGVAPNDRVAICLERSADMVVALLGVLKAGGAYVPLDPGYPVERLAFMLADAKPAALLTHSSLIKQLSTTGTASVPTIATDNDPSLAQQPATNPDPAALAITADHSAYVIYTSGSTGQPKGATVFHRGLVNLLHWYANDYDFDSHDRVLVVSSFSFDLTQKNLFVCLFTGGELHLAAPQFDPAAIVATIAERGITTLNLTPSAFYALVDEAARRPGALASLRRVFLGGEPISVPRLAALGASYPKLEIINSYGPTECTDVVAAYRLPRESGEAGATYLYTTPPIGRPICNTQLYVLDARLQPVPIGAIGEIYIGGAGVGGGYLDRPELTAKRFIADPFASQEGSATRARLYKTGDLGRWRADGLLDYLGRNDFQVKIRGHRIELGEIESRLVACNGVREAIVIARPDPSGESRLVAYVMADEGFGLDTNAVRGQLSAQLADYMVPALFVVLPAFPLTPSGKVDRNALPDPERKRPELDVPYQKPIGEFETAICAAFTDVLEIDRVGRDDNFFDLGGSSLQAVRVLTLLADRTGRTLSAPTIFAHATPAALARAADRADEPAADAPALARDQKPNAANALSEPIAIVGMAGRFPGAQTVEALWQNLLAGHDGITQFSLDMLDASVPESARQDPTYVRARGVIDDVECFDNAFFGISAREAEIMDPQHRLFLELAWECLERAGYAPDRTAGSVGVFGGIYGPSYLQRNLMAHPEAIERAGDLQVLLSNDKDYAVLRVAHKLNLKGPAVAVHTSCSTSLVAIAQAVDNLRLGRCDMALAGGVSVTSPSATGYFYNEGSMLSADGHTRTFDADATGTIFNDGGALVLLKPLSTALAEGDQIFAVIRSVATNNDGGGKASFTAPSVDGQAAVIAMAHREAGIDARSISYLEAHGTATPLGDPIEVEALTRAFRRSTTDTGFCRIGSLKSNIGHIVAAAGAGSVIKTALSLHHEQLPATIHFRSPNPKIDFANSPFIVNAGKSAWPRCGEPRRAGVSNFGVGGTNAHAVLEEAPLVVPSSAAQGVQLLQLSARTPAALEAMAANLADHLDAQPELNLADVAYTLQHGRSHFAHRLCVVGDSAAELSAALRTPGAPTRIARSLGAAGVPWVWLFPGQGAQYAGMGRELYARDDAFKAAIDECMQALEGELEFDLRERMFEGSADALTATATTQPATFCLEYALARTWLARGAQPAALIGHSVGEFAAAVLAGVMSLADAARLVALRGKLMQALPAGSMLSVRLSAEQVLQKLPAGLSLAADNSPTATVVAGSETAIEAFALQLDADGIATRILQTSHAFHSDMMDGALAPFEAAVRAVKLAAPKLPIVSTLTGDWMTGRDATDPQYWARHMREPVRFSPALRCAQARHSDAAFLEIGPRGTLVSLARQHASAGKSAPIAVTSLGDTPDSETRQCLLAQGHLWTLGVALPAANAHPAEGRHRVRLPTYAFERKRFWLAPTPATAQRLPAAGSSSMSASTVDPGAVRADLPAAASPHSHLSTNANAMITAPAAPTAPIPAPSTDRRPQLANQLRDLFEDVAGLDLSAAAGDTNFVEMGLDSLTLTQAATQVKKQFKVNLSFRQLMETLRTFDTLAAFLDQNLAPQPAAVASMPSMPSMPIVTAQSVMQQPPSPQATAPLIAPLMATPMVAPMAIPSTDSGDPLIRQLIAQQMQLMQQQIALLAGAATNPAVPIGQQAAVQLATRPIALPMTQLAVQPPAAASVPNSPATETPEAEAVQRYDVKKAFGAIARIHTEHRESTPRQKARLASFIRRYAERTAKSKAFTAEHRSHMADPRVVNGFRPATKEITYQIVVERSKGSRVWDIDGNEYVDVLNGFGMNMFGWQPDFVQDAVKRQLDTGYEIGPQHPLAADVTRLVCELTGFDRAGLCNTGSEAVMAAIRIARTATGRSTIVTFAGSYHGTFDEVLVRAGRSAKGIPAAPGVMRGMFGDIRVLDYGTPEALEFIRANADDLAAVLVEPVQSRRPDFQPREFLQEVRDITSKSGACLIFDEVITGFRSHLGGAQALFGVKADLASYGKVIGGGFPVGVIAGKREFMDALDGGGWQYGDDSIPTVGVTYFAGTFVRHPLALAAAKASLEHLKAAGPALQTQLNLHTAALADELTAFCREVGAPLEVRYFASLFRVSWLEDHPLQDLLFAMMRSRGVHILDNFPCFLTTAHSHEDIATIKSAFKESIAELQEADFLPSRVVSKPAFDAAKPPVPNARLGRDRDGQPAWFVPDPSARGKFMKI